MTPFDPARHHRRSIRLKGYDYREAGAYVVTVCANDRACLFGEVVDGAMDLNDAGRMVQAMWEALPERFPGVDLDAWVIMPNHLHGIIVLGDAEGAPTATRAPLVGAHSPAGAQSPAAKARPALGDVVGAFKSLSTVAYIRGVSNAGWPPFRVRLWQRNYYEHIIRDDADLWRIQGYIANNPAQWQEDTLYPLSGR